MKRWGFCHGWLVALLVLSAGFVSGAEDGKEPEFEGKTASFWLDQLPFIDVDETGQMLEKGFPEFYENLAQAEAHQKKVEEIRNQAPKAIQAIGTNALPFIWARLTTASLPGVDSTQRIIDPATGLKKEMSGRVIRGQAIEALILLKKHGPVFEPKLVAIVSDTMQPKVNRGAAFHVLKQIKSGNESKYADLLKRE